MSKNKQIKVTVTVDVSKDGYTWTVTRQGDGGYMASTDRDLHKVVADIQRSVRVQLVNTEMTLRR